RHLKARAGVGKIPNRAIKPRRFLAENDLRCLQYPFTKNSSFFLHGPMPHTDMTIGFLRSQRFGKLKERIIRNFNTRGRYRWRQSTLSLSF
ncbi:MAG: hypothetical protein WBL81_20810, partial [Pseudolabrys sp.]